MWHGTTASLKLMSSLQPGFCKIRRAEECFYLVPPSDCPADAMRMFTRHRNAVTTRNVTWRRSPPSPPFSQDPPTTCSDGPFDEEKTDASAGEQPIVKSPLNPTTESLPAEPPSVEPMSTSTASRTVIRQLGHHNQAPGDGDGATEGREPGGRQRSCGRAC